jgi:hypothetical protein
MSRKGNCWDNAVAESFFSSMLYELELGATWHTDADVARDVGAYIELFYNPRRRHSHNRYLSPVDFEREVVAARNWAVQIGATSGFGFGFGFGFSESASASASVSVSVSVSASVSVSVSASASVSASVSSSAAPLRPARPRHS